MMNLAGRIRMLIDILREEDIGEIEVRNWFWGIRVSRHAPSAVSGAEESTARGEAAAPGPVATESVATESPAGEVSAPETPAGEQPAAESAREGLETIVSPMVGTFYRSAGPGKEPFIEVGSRVETGQVLCIIEAMKLMNEIEAERGGIIREVLVEDRQPVEFGQPLFLVESA